jgi:hypothetical protein
MAERAKGAGDIFFTCINMPFLSMSKNSDLILPHLALATFFNDFCQKYILIIF